MLTRDDLKAIDSLLVRRVGEIVEKRVDGVVVRRINELVPSMIDMAITKALKPVIARLNKVEKLLHLAISMLDKDIVGVKKRVEKVEWRLGASV